VLMSEINPFRIQLLSELGLRVVDPRETDLEKLVTEETATAGADVVFEVSGSAAGAELMTKLGRTRGRIVIVAVFSQKREVDLFRFFWRELRMCGARVYEPQDFEEAIRLAASGSIPIPKLITNTVPLEQFEFGLQQMEKGGEVMKVLVECS
jgi:threonine dehydrogenase-like Zn-dependent dehydrogenase